MHYNYRYNQDSHVISYTHYNYRYNQHFQVISVMHYNYRYNQHSQVISLMHYNYRYNQHSDVISYTLYKVGAVITKRFPVRNSGKISEGISINSRKICLRNRQLRPSRAKLGKICPTKFELLHLLPYLHSKYF